MTGSCVECDTYIFVGISAARPGNTATVYPVAVAHFSPEIMIDDIHFYGKSLNDGWDSMMLFTLEAKPVTSAI